MDFCKRGELLDYIKKLECFDEPCSRFYAAEVVSALEYMHSKNIIHRLHHLLYFFAAHSISWQFTCTCLLYLKKA